MTKTTLTISYTVPQDGFDKTLAENIARACRNYAHTKTFLYDDKFARATLWNAPVDAPDNPIYVRFAKRKDGLYGSKADSPHFYEHVKPGDVLIFNIVRDGHASQLEEELLLTLSGLLCTPARTRQE